MGLVGIDDGWDIPEHGEALADDQLDLFSDMDGGGVV